MRLDMHGQAVVFIVDDDQALGESLAELLERDGLRSRVFPSAGTFLNVYHPDQPGCLLLDVRLPGRSGLELQAELCRQGRELPIIMMTGYADVDTAVTALKAGALAFLEKPLDGKDVRRWVGQALERDARQRRQADLRREIQHRLARLTLREREVLDLVMRGMANKEAANQLGISHRTVEVHRKRIMEKMRAVSVAELVRMVLTVLPRLGDPNGCP